ncbi:TlpA family protein disulfide reductase [Cytobacillus kochii]|uniref:TlpA family protein disulfide reductase n=1 Tax=Cytobacillus kochii TaxID=859143 RepID=UPI00203FA953|nr:redoxin domain-containing protein [Cytobacillus kochii]MCM3324817.1 peroxiredoxin family protein [Cytobacillus kochii]MCM3347210.1 peroxiredoxin family protein [Cytobacillus kochii]
MFTNIILTIVLLILLIELYVIYFLFNFIKKFLGEIRGIKNIQFSSIYVGDEAPMFREMDLNNNIVALKDELDNYDVVLLFASSSCNTCIKIIDDFSKLVEGVNPEKTLIIVNNEKEKTRLQKFHNGNIYQINSPKLFTMYKITRTPSFIVVNKDGIITNLGELENAHSLINLLKKTTNNYNSQKII